MSTVKIQGNSGGSGSVTVASPNTNSNRTISLPDADGSFVTADSSNNVGIACTPNLNTVSRLFIAGDITRINGSGGFLFNVNYSSANNRWEFAGTSAATGAGWVDSGSGNYTFQSTGSTTGTAGTSAPMTEWVRIASSGNVGIGTTSPGAKLQVSSANSSLIGLINGTTRGIRFGADSAVSYIEGVDNTGSTSYQPLVLGGANVRFTLSGAECARFETGNLLIGLTSLAYTTARLIVSAASGSGAYIATSYAGDVGTPGIWVSKYDNNSTTSQILVKFNINNNNTGSGQINANGANSAAFGSWSDRRLKENIEDLPPQLSNICALRPVEFDYIKSEGGGHQIGFIAQEIQQVYPDVVGERAPDGMLTVTGWSKTEARLVKAIQEQQAIIEQLKADVAALKGEK